MSDFIDLIFTSDPTALADDAVQYIEDHVPGYESQSAALETILIEALAPMAADQADVASQVPSAIWRAFGTKLANIQYEQGSPAHADVVFTLADDAGHTVPAGTQLVIADLGFFLATDLTVAASGVSGLGQCFAVENGTQYNGLSAPCELVDALDVVSSVAVSGASTGGLDQEDDDAYQNRLAGQLALQAPRPITSADFALMSLSFLPADGTDQQEIGRAVAIDTFNPAATGTFTANRATSSPTLASVSDTTGLGNGTVLSGTGIPAGTTVLSVSGSTVTMSKNATSTATGGTVNSTGLYGQEKAVTVFATDAFGVAVNPDTLSALATWLDGFRETNFLVFTRSPTTTAVYITCSIHLYPDSDRALTAAAVQQAILDYLSPATWGTRLKMPNSTAWLNDTAVRYNKLIGVIEQVTGVDYVIDLKIGLSPSPSGTTDLTLSGPVPLPLADTTTVPLPSVA